MVISCGRGDGRGLLRDEDEDVRAFRGGKEAGVWTGKGSGGIRVEREFDTERGEVILRSFLLLCFGFGLIV
jgi:hypothetical protein